MGRRVLQQLLQEGYPDVRVLSRDPRRLARALPETWRIITGRLEDPQDWSEQLQGVDTVLHLAAATGKARRRTHLAVTREGTARLLECAEAAGVRRMLFVSSIAVTYRDRRSYHYAEAKLAAEGLVRRSTMDWLIVRPTLVLGPGSPLQASLRRLALLPMPVLFGRGAQLVQPVHVDDLARLLVAALALEPWGGHAITVGGPDVLSIADLLNRMRAAAQRRRAPALRLPLGPARALLQLAEPLLFPMLPFTAGQLAFFANPSVVQSDPLLSRLSIPSRGVGEMLSDSGQS